MKKGIACFTSAFIVLLVVGFSTKSTAEVRIGAEISIPLAPYVFPAPPPMAPIPGTYVYYAPDIDVDVLFYHGYWYRPYEGRWYRGRSYNGPWVHLALSGVPRAVIAVPHDFRHVSSGHRGVPYREFNRNWRKWERERHWDRDEEWRGREDHREDRGRYEGRGHGHR